MGPSWTLWPDLNKLGKRPLHTKFQASEPSGFEEDFCIFFLCISMVPT